MDADSSRISLDSPRKSAAQDSTRQHRVSHLTVPDAEDASSDETEFQSPAAELSQNAKAGDVFFGFGLNHTPTSLIAGPPAEESDRAERAVHTVFGDATRLAIMLAAVNHAGRRSGSLVNYSAMDEDCRTEAGSSTPERRRRRSANSRKPSRAANRLPCSFNPHEAVNDSQTIGALEATPDCFFANSASMCVLFNESSETESGSHDSLLAGILLGVTAGSVAARQARRRKAAATVRPKPAAPRYSGATVVFAD